MQGNYLKGTLPCMGQSLAPYKLIQFLKYLSSYSDIFGHVGTELDQKAKINSKFIMSSTGKQIITIQILPSISRSKDNHTMKFGQLVEYKKSYTK